MILNKNRLKKFITFFLFFVVNKIYRFKLSSCHSPLISIIIAVDKSFNSSYDCLYSILNSEPSISYEILMINEASVNVLELAKYKNFTNLTNIVFYNSNSGKYLFRNYNKVVKLSKGKYIIILKANTKVHKDWLTSLLKVIEKDETIGMVGSKLIYQNGLLKEAGGIVWNNGEFTIFGKGDNAEKSEYNYVKEVDYLSTTSVIIRKSIWENINGFDVRFFSLNYTDIDFAFKIRKNGYKVIYQPKSIVEQYEVFPVEKDMTPLHKTISKKKFIEKWENELKYQLNKNNTFIARDRGFNKSRIFVIDRFVPNYDKDAGSRCSYMYLNIFKEIGLQVTFLGDNLNIIEPYTTILQQKGIEILFGNEYKDKNFETWLQKNIKNFKYIYLQRPDITSKYIDLIKQYYSGKIIYFAHDLHYIRLFREYNITHNFNKLEQSNYMKKIETNIFNKVDVIHVVGSYEYKTLKNLFQNKTISNIPLYIYEDQFKKREQNFTKRKDLVFVGSLEHSPNFDGILWFTKEIYPEIIKKFPNMTLYIISSVLPPTITEIESKNVKIIGYLSDEDLQLIYQKCRISIAPLRFGAGVKGKIVEASYYQIPMVTTTIGGEGLDYSIGSFIMEDDAKKMAEIICQLYVDFRKLKQMSDSGKVLIEKYFSKKRAKDIILKDLKR